MTKDDVTVDVVVTTYNSERFIETCLTSIIKQTYKNWTLVIVDDGSKDRTVDIIRSFIKKHRISKKCRLYVINDNRGYGMSLKTGIERGDGEIIIIVDSDDALAHEGAITIMVNHHKKNPDVALMYSNYFECSEDLNTKSLIKCRNPKPGETYLGPFINGKYTGTHLKVSHLKAFKRKHYKMTEGLDGTLKKAVDKDLILKLEEVGGLKHIAEGLYLHRRHEHSISSGFKHLSGVMRNAIIEKKTAMYITAHRRRTDKANAENLANPHRKL